MSSVNENISQNKIDIVTNVENNVTVNQPTTSVVTVTTQGPQGVVGPQGPQGIPGSDADLSEINTFTGSAQTNLDTLNEFTSSVVLTTQTSSMSVATASFALFAVSASVEITKEVSSSHANTADVANGLQGQPSIDVTAITASGDIVVPQYIKHKGNETTFINFTDNRIRFKAGDIGFFDMEKDASTPYPATINPGGNRINFRVVDRNTELLLKTDSEAFKVNLYHAGNQKLETAVGGVNITGSLNISGSIIGDGSGLTNIPASGITGLNLSRIASGSVTASIAPNKGFEVNTNVTASGTVSIQTTSPLISLKRTDNSNNSSIDFIGQSGFIGSKIQFIGNSNDLTFGTYDGSSVVERLRLEDGTDGKIKVTGDTQITGSLLITGSKIHLRGESRLPGPILELESIGGSSGKDVYVKVGDASENYAYVFGADDTGNSFRISSGNYSDVAIGTNDKFIIEGNNIEFPAGNISGSITSTASFGTYVGDGSQLSGISTTPFPFTGDAQITGSLIVSGSFNAFRVATTNLVLGTNAGANLNPSATGNVILGNEAGMEGSSTTQKNVFIGDSAGEDITGTSRHNVFIGLTAGKQGTGK